MHESSMKLSSLPLICNIKLTKSVILYIILFYIFKRYNKDILWNFIIRLNRDENGNLDKLYCFNENIYIYFFWFL